VSDIAPWFESGSGYHRLGNWAPGSIEDNAAKADAAYRCVVFRMRHQGRRLPAAEVAAMKPSPGGIVCTQLGTWPHWHAELLRLPDLSKQLMHMHQVRLVRMRGGFRQYQGVEYNEMASASWPQTWFCAPNETAAIAVLDKMAGAPLD
jgi:hypothetical protein